MSMLTYFFFFFQAEDGIRDKLVTGVQTCALPIYFNQEGTFVLNNGNVRSGRDDFWVVDAGISYRLPQRYGFITVGASNLFDQAFRFFDRDLKNPSIQPDRMLFVRFTLALP